MTKEWQFPTENVTEGKRFTRVYLENLEPVFYLILYKLSKEYAARN